MKKIKSVLAVSLIFLLLSAMLFSFFYSAFRLTFVHADAQTDYIATPYTSAKAMCLIEAETGRVLAEKNAETSLPMASTTKIMTAITAIENCEDLDTPFVIDEKAVGVSGTSMYLRKGETLSMRDLLYGLMTVSGNDASVAIGMHVGGTIERFVDLMNFTAYKIGADSTHFENTHGLDEKGHYTSAHDLALISAYALKNETFKEIVSTQNIKVVSAEGKTRYLHNKNKLLQTFDGAIGVKTGYTDDAGRCLVSAAERDGMRLVCVVLNCGAMFEDCAKLLEWGFANYKMVNLCEGLVLPKTLPIEQGELNEVEIASKGSFYFPLSEGEKENVEIKVELLDSLVPPMDEGSKVGTYEIYFNNELRFSGEIVTIKTVRTRTLAQRLQDVLEKW